jgi:hypothetical protein
VELLSSEKDIRPTKEIIPVGVLPLRHFYDEKRIIIPKETVLFDAGEVSNGHIDLRVQS